MEDVEGQTIAVLEMRRVITAPAWSAVAYGEGATERRIVLGRLLARCFASSGRQSRELAQLVIDLFRSEQADVNMQVSATMPEIVKSLLIVTGNSQRGNDRPLGHRLGGTSSRNRDLPRSLLGLARLLAIVRWQGRNGALLG